MYSSQGRSVRYILIVLLAAFLLFDLYEAGSQTGLQETGSGCPQTYLTSVSGGQICPVRVPEKVSIHEEASSNWERCSRRESEQIAFLFIFCILFSFLLLSRTGHALCIPESCNLPHVRILLFIHRKDGKGPEVLSFS